MYLCLARTILMNPEETPRCPASVRTLKCWAKSACHSPAYENIQMSLEVTYHNKLVFVHIKIFVGNACKHLAPDLHNKTSIGPEARKQALPYFARAELCSSISSTELAYGP